jgi:hypothetical protein
MLIVISQSPGFRWGNESARADIAMATTLAAHKIADLFNGSILSWSEAPKGLFL